MAPVNPAPLQLYVTPAKGPPCNVADVLVHVITVAKLAVAAGGVVLDITATVFTDVHKLLIWLMFYSKQSL